MALTLPGRRLRIERDSVRILDLIGACHPDRPLLPPEPDAQDRVWNLVHLAAA